MRTESRDCMPWLYKLVLVIPNGVLERATPGSGGQIVNIFSQLWIQWYYADNVKSAWQEYLHKRYCQMLQIKDFFLQESTLNIYQNTINQSSH